MLEIKGRKVVLKKAESKDIDELYFWKYEEELQVAKQWNGPYITEDRITKMEYRREWSEQLFQDVPASLVIIAGEKAIGYVGAYWVDKNTDWAETGIVIYDKDFWNGGYGSEAYSLWIDFLFRTTHLHRLGMSTWSGNIRMMKVAEKLGMKEEARVREARKVDGTYFDAIKMGMLRKEWQALNAV